ncbi:MAG: DUF2177 family protein [Hyphomicrobiales bacterium]|jgi:uncharacterized membrane protein|nr:DUF2177 family protein [Hyphomicrobiales bacterium]
MKYAIAYVSTMAVLLAIDAVWLTTMASRLYRRHIGDLLADAFNSVPAVLFYMIYAVGIVVFAVVPALGSGRWLTALTNGALLGFVAYAAYDLTNHATLRGWPVVITVIDMCWGTLLTAVAAAAGFLVTRYFSPEG